MVNLLRIGRQESTSKYWGRIGLNCCVGVLVTCIWGMSSIASANDFVSSLLEEQQQMANSYMQGLMQESLDASGDQGRATIEQAPLNNSIDWSTVPEKEVMEGMRLYSEQDLNSVYLEPMPRVRRPSLNAQYLSPEEKNFCLLVQAQAVEDLTNINAQCLDMSNYVQHASLGFKKYTTLLGVLEVFRVKYELGLTEADLQEFFDLEQIYGDAEKFLSRLYNMPTKPAGSMLTHEEANACFEVITLQEMFFEGLKVGYPLERVNQVNTAYNQKCKGRVMRTREFFQRKRGDNILLSLMPIVAEIGHRASENVYPKTFLFPFEGTDEQRIPEVLEAQRYLKQLGYLYNQPTGEVDYSTSNAIMEFERDLGLVQTGLLSFTNMMRLRLFTVGYHPKYLL